MFRYFVDRFHIRVRRRGFRVSWVRDSEQLPGGEGGGGGLKVYTDHLLISATTIPQGPVPRGLLGLCGRRHYGRPHETYTPTHVSSVLTVFPTGPTGSKLPTNSLDTGP